jgi:putative FmdB family regulatory protein
MPLYDYACAGCGDFRAFRPMRESAEPQPCPGCARLSERTLSAPFLSGSADGWLSRPKGHAPGASWRSMCGFGCSHANCAS